MLYIILISYYYITCYILICQLQIRLFQSAEIKDLLHDRCGELSRLWWQAQDYRGHHGHAADRADTVAPELTDPPSEDHTGASAAAGRFRILTLTRVSTGEKMNLARKGRGLC
jgi:hypothetical protein